MADVNHPGSSLTASATISYVLPVFHPGSDLTATATLIYVHPVFHPTSSLSADAVIDYTATPPAMETSGVTTITITSGGSMSMTVEPIDPPTGVEVTNTVLTPEDLDLTFDRYGRPQ